MSSDCENLSFQNVDSANHHSVEQLEQLSEMLGGEQFGQHASHGEQGRPRQEGRPLDRSLPQDAQGEGAQRKKAVVEVRPDPGREQRKGVPEVIYGETKEPAQIITMARKLLEGSGRAIISRMRPEVAVEVKTAFEGQELRFRETARALVLYRSDYIRRDTGGHVGVISAGTSDIPVAEEAALIAEEMGCRVTCIYDVGVAGLYRLLEPLRNLLADEVEVVIVAAGMDGALPSVVAGLVPVPVIGLPTSIGYGMGGKGVAALLSMLQTCAPGLSVVNIDNGIGAGSTAAMIANRVARARKHQSQ